MKANIHCRSNSVEHASKLTAQIRGVKREAHVLSAGIPMLQNLRDMKYVSHTDNHRKFTKKLKHYHVLRFFLGSDFYLNDAASNVFSRFETPEYVFQHEDVGARSSSRLRREAEIFRSSKTSWHSFCTKRLSSGLIFGDNEVVNIGAAAAGAVTTGWGKLGKRDVIVEYTSQTWGVSLLYYQQRGKAQRSDVMRGE